MQLHFEARSVRYNLPLLCLLVPIIIDCTTVVVELSDIKETIYHAHKLLLGSNKNSLAIVKKIHYDWDLHSFAHRIVLYTWMILRGATSDFCEIHRRCESKHPFVFRYSMKEDRHPVLFG